MALEYQPYLPETEENSWEKKECLDEVDEEEDSRQDSYLKNEQDSLEDDGLQKNFTVDFNCHTNDIHDIHTQRMQKLAMGGGYEIAVIGLTYILPKLETLLHFQIETDLT